MIFKYSTDFFFIPPITANLDFDILFWHTKAFGENAPSSVAFHLRLELFKITKGPKLKLFYCDFEFGSIDLSIHSIVLACGWYRWIWISETLHAPRLTQDNCIKNGIQMTREAKEEELAPAISQSTILKESLMWDILRLICELFPKSKMIQ